MGLFDRFVSAGSKVIADKKGIGQIAVQRWFERGEGWTHCAWFAEDVSKLTNLNTITAPLVGKVPQGQIGKLHYLTDGKNHYYGVVYHDPHCVDQSRFPRNYVFARFSEAVPDAMKSELQATLEKLPVPRTKRGSVGTYNIEIQGNGFKHNLPDGVDLIRNPKETPYHPADEATKSGVDLKTAGDQKPNDLRRE